MRFEANDQKIEEVLFSSNKFRIPRYQRPYAWTEDQISDFWNDLLEDGSSYFMGSFILNYESLESEGYIDVIDGQQRILTITIFSAVLRDIVKSYDSDLSNRIQRSDIMFEDRRTGKYFVRVTTGDSTKKFFEEYIQNNTSDIYTSKPKTIEEKRIKKVYEFFYKKVKAVITNKDTNESKVDWIENTRVKLSDLTVIRIKINNEEDAYEIFETTNARGVDLSVSDLLKNVIFKNIPKKDSRDEAKEVWTNISNNIENSNTELKRFIRYYWLSKFSFVTEKTLFREMKTVVLNTQWQDLLYTLWTDSENWKMIYDGTDEDFKGLKDGHKIYRSIFAIRLMKVTQCNVLLLSL